MKIPTIKLNDGNAIPILGLGTWKSQPNAVKSAVIEAVKAGYRHIDCAFVYGNENEVGDALTELFRDKVVKREDLFITSKLWNTFHSESLVKPALEHTLSSLKIDYLDLYLIHWPIGYAEGHEIKPVDPEGNIICSDVDYVDTWKGMERVKREGLAKSIGVSNFNEEQVKRILENCQIPPAVNQVESHPYLAQENLLDFLRLNKIAMTAYSPLGSPDRRWAKESDPYLLEDSRVVRIAKKYNKSPAQVLIRYQIERNVVVIPKTVTKARILDNMRVFDFNLTVDEVDELSSTNSNFRFCPLEWVSHHKYYPFAIESPQVLPC